MYPACTTDLGGTCARLIDALPNFGSESVNESASDFVGQMQKRQPCNNVCEVRLRFTT